MTTDVLTTPDAADAARSSSDAAIRIDGVSKSFGSTRAVQDLDLVVPAGSLCGFLGPNGAGKSTTIRMIMSIIYPDTGQVSVLGGSALKNKDRIGYLPEERGVYRKMKVGEFIEYIARLKGLTSRDARTRAVEWLERVDLPGCYGKKCQDLSKGMQQKVQFIAAVIHDPELLILDEPFSGLDPVNAKLLNELIRDLNSQGVTIIFSTHVLFQAEQICNRIFLINHGAKLLDATMSEIREEFDPRTLLVEPLEPGPPPEAPGVMHAARVEDTAGYELTLEDGADPQAVMQAVMAAAPMRSVELRRPTLEEVFVRLVLQDEGEEAARAVREGLSHG